MNTNCDWDMDESRVTVPSRTRLYRLEPIGIGTPMVECLSSFIHRLAEAHGLPTWVLLRRELAPRFERESVLGSRGGCDLLGRMGGAINGNNVSAVEAVRILQTLTGQGGLSALTFGRLRSLVARRKIIRICQAWCPMCLESWRQEQKPIYQPLLWLLSDLAYCPEHGCKLEDHCGVCGRTHTPLGRYRWNGRCPKCWTWMGAADKAAGSDSSKPFSPWEEFVLASIHPLMLAIQKLPDNAPASAFASNMTALIDQRFVGNAAAAGRALRATRRTVCDWAEGKLRPSVSTLLLLECRLGVPALDWVSGVVPIADLPGRHEVTVDAIRTEPRRYQPEVLERQLRSVIEGHESPPPSLRAACEQIGIHQTVAVRNAPELALQIMTRFRLFQTEQKIARQTSMKQVVASSVHRLMEEGRSLSFYELAKVLPAGVSTCDKLVLEEFNRLRREIMYSAKPNRKPLTNAEP